jgi:ubiquinone/menaquinone biosynthesis C-methylase UbiE
VASEVDRLHAWLREQLIVSDGATVLDLGCGSGNDVRQFALSHPASRFIGLDRSVPEGAFPDNARFVPADLTQGIPLDDGSADAIFSVNLLECLPDRPGFLADCARVLRPGGRIVVAHFDWDTQTFDGEDIALVREIVHAFNDWKQAWMEAIDPWAGRRLWSLCSAVKDLEGEIRTYTLTTTDFSPESYGRRQAESFEALVRRGIIRKEDFDRFWGFLERSAARGEFFYSVTMYAFVGHRRPAVEA